MMVVAKNNTNFSSPFGSGKLRLLSIRQKLVRYFGGHICERCKELTKRFDIRSPDEYQSFASQLDDMVKRGLLVVVNQNVESEIVSATIWPEDSVQNTLKCTTCNESFKLYADTYHGRSYWSGAIGSKQQENVL